MGERRTDQGHDQDAPGSGEANVRWVGCVVSTAIAIFIALAVTILVKWDVVQRGDLRLVSLASDVTRAHPMLRSFFLLWQAIFMPWVVYAEAAPVVVTSWRRTGARRAVWAIATMLSGWILSSALKNAIGRPRPNLPDPGASAPGFSFPSGHAANCTLAIVTCFLMVYPTLSRRGRWGSGCLGALAIMVTAADRVFLGVHFPTDVVAGVAIGLAFSCGSYLAARIVSSRFLGTA